MNVDTWSPSTLSVVEGCLEVDLHVRVSWSQPAAPLPLSPEPCAHSRAAPLALPAVCPPRCLPRWLMLLSLPRASLFG